MARTVSIGIQDFEQYRSFGSLYIDKTYFISDWWNSGDSVTLITRPRRFGKTLNMNMLECFFSTRYEDRADLFEGLSVAKDAKLMAEQGKWPVVFISFAAIKSPNFPNMVYTTSQLFTDIARRYDFLLQSPALSDDEKEGLKRWTSIVPKEDTAIFILRLCHLLQKHFNKKVIILMDEYDTPMQEAWLCGYWEDAVEFMRGMFNNTFKTNPALFRAVITGITRISKESMFSDINNLNVVSTTSPQYQTAFGFTEEEVFAAMNEQGLTEKDTVKRWYDGFVFGGVADIYNPWSILEYMKNRQFKPYWINTSSNSLVGSLIRTGSVELKETFSDLLEQKPVKTTLDEEVVFSELSESTDAIWGLLVAAGYLKITDAIFSGDEEAPLYTLSITNRETRAGLKKLVRAWFGAKDHYGYSSFTKALLRGDLDEMNIYMSRVAEFTLSSFDPYGRGGDPELFYHGLVLGLIIELEKTHMVRSNRESGYGRYDVMLIPRELGGGDAIIIEFKLIRRDRGEKELSDTVAAALKQIEEKHYEAELIDMGFAPEHIRKYGFAFDGKEVLIGD